MRWRLLYEEMRIRILIMFAVGLDIQSNGWNVMKDWSLVLVELFELLYVLRLLDLTCSKYSPYS
jgi:hypothetical protein